MFKKKDRIAVFNDYDDTHSLGVTGAHTVLFI